MKNKTFLIGILALFIAFPTMAQFKFSGEFRPRTENNHGLKSLVDVDQKAKLLTTQRTRLNLNFKAEGITTKLVLQDVRLWGAQRQLVGNEMNGVSIHEAWGEAGLSDNFALRLGRQGVVYDNQRKFGSVGWAQQGRSHDLALLKYNGIVEVHLGLAYHESGMRGGFYNGPDAYKFMQFVWLSKKAGNLKISLLALNNGLPKDITDDQGEITSQDIIYTKTLGPNLVYNRNNLTASGNFYYQTGTLLNGNSLSAFEYMLQVDLKALDKLSVGISYEVLSGTNAESEDAASRSFTPFYGTNHKFNGHMDYFYVGNHGGSVGLNDLTGRLKLAVGKVKLGLDLHGFWSFAPIAGINETYLGTELDLSANIPINRAVSMVAGYSHLFATDAMEVLKGGSADETQNWAWVMFTFKPTFYE